MAAKRRNQPRRKQKPAARRRQAKDAPLDEPATSPERQVIAMDEAVALLKTSRPTFYRWLRAGKVKGMKIGRQWRFYREDIERFLAGQEPRVDVPAGMGALIKALQARVLAVGGEPTTRPDAGDAQRAVDLMILLAVALGASDIHLAASRREVDDATVATLRGRVDGVLHQEAEFPSRLLPSLIERWKLMAACNVQEKLKPQDGRIRIDLLTQNAKLDLRVCFVPAQLGEALTVRVLAREAVRFDLDRIDYAPRDRERILCALEQPWGLIVVTGPAGSGKTTLLYTCLTHLNRPEVKILTVEDPVEYVLPGIVQIQVRPDAGVTFATAMRAMLRSDPDVLMMGEARDREALMIAHQAALTGHLVFTTLHADTAAGALRRMVDMGSPPFVVADSVKLALSQRLVRLLCPDCSVERPPSAERLRRAADLARAGGVDFDALPRSFRESVGCAKCGNTGYRGRTVIAETLEMSPEVAAALVRGASVEEVQTAAIGQGMTTMAADGVRRAAAGRTSLAEVMRTLGTRLI